MKIQVLPAQTEDASLLTIIAIASESHWGYTENHLASWVPKLIVSEYSIENNIVYKLLKGNEVVGFYMLKTGFNKVIDLEFLFLLPVAIGKGYGKSLLLHAIEKTKTLNAKNIKVISDPNAEGFFVKFGFEKLTEEKTNIHGQFLSIMLLKL